MPVIGKNGLIKGKGKKTNIEVLKDEIKDQVKESKCNSLEKNKIIESKPKVRKYIKF